MSLTYQLYGILGLIRLNQPSFGPTFLPGATEYDFGVYKGENGISLIRYTTFSDFSFVIIFRQ